MLKIRVPVMVERQTTHFEDNPITAKVVGTSTPEILARSTAWIQTQTLAVCLQTGGEVLAPAEIVDASDALQPPCCPRCGNTAVERMSYAELIWNERHIHGWRTQDDGTRVLIIGVYTTENDGGEHAHWECRADTPHGVCNARFSFDRRLPVEFE